MKQQTSPTNAATIFLFFNSLLHSLCYRNQHHCSQILCALIHAYNHDVDVNHGVVCQHLSLWDKSAAAKHCENPAQPIAWKLVTWTLAWGQGRPHHHRLAGLEELEGATLLRQLGLAVWLRPFCNTRKQGMLLYTMNCKSSGGYSSRKWYTQTHVLTDRQRSANNKHQMHAFVVQLYANRTVP